MAARALIPACPVPPGAPPAIAPFPTSAQVAFQRTELAAYLHFGLNTFDGTEYGDSRIDAPSLFNPRPSTPGSGWPP